MQDEAIRKLLGKKPQNHLDFDAQGNVYQKYFNHITAQEVLKIEPYIWNTYYKFCFERNPFDRAISFYYFSKQNKPIKFDNWLKNNYYPNSSTNNNWHIYTINDKAVVGFVGKYESLLSDLTFICEKLNIPFDGYLPKAKGFFRDNQRPYSEFLNAEQMEIIRECNSSIIDLLGYNNENQNNHNISVVGKSKKQPENYTEEYYNQRGYLLQKQGKLDEALINYAQAIGINPQKYWAYYHTLGSIFAENNLYKEAVEAYYQAIKIKPDFSWTHYHLAVLLEKQGKLDEASTYYQNAFQLYPNLSYYKNKS